MGVGSADTAATSRALVICVAGLPAFALIKVFQPGFFAREDTKTPLRFAALAALIAGGIIVYFSLCQITGAIRLADLRRAFTRS
ncbi:MAG: hypothetical protein H5U13_07380 [Parvibaculum sp.]|nr:hypothetical protein [Parvibaculum sp.]